MFSPITEANHTDLAKAGFSAVKGAAEKAGKDSCRV